MERNRGHYGWFQALDPMIFVLVVASAGCSGRLVPAQARIQDYIINTPNQKIFEAVLKVAQTRNLDVAVLEKQSGLIRFETASLTSVQLDAYCVYPYVRSDGTPWDTFAAWNQRSLTGNAGPVRGRDSMTLLISEKDSTTSINIRGNWVSYNRTETTPCTSNGVFEGEFINDVKREVSK